MITIYKGLIFNDNCEHLVNTVNCEGFMGKGIALEFKLRFPEMFKKYKQDCSEELVRIGEITTFKERGKTIINFPTKNSYKHPSKIEYLEKGLASLKELIVSKNIPSICIPMLGTQNGGLDKLKVTMLIEQYLSDLETEIKIYDFDPDTYENQMLDFRQKLESQDLSIYNLTSTQSELVLKALNVSSTKKLSDLLRIKGIGETVITKIYTGLYEDKIRGGGGKSQLNLFG